MQVSCVSLQTVLVTQWGGGGIAEDGVCVCSPNQARFPTGAVVGYFHLRSVLVSLGVGKARVVVQK